MDLEQPGNGVRPILATQWDADWYLSIADHGYAHQLGTAFDANNLAFFPLYPVLVKAVAALTPGSRATPGLVIAVVCSVLAAWGIHAVGSHLHGLRVGVLLTVLWAAKTFHPARFPALDLAAATASFYREFFGYSLSEAEVREILSGTL